jgi:hypothetical protein
MFSQRSNNNIFQMFSQIPNKYYNNKIFFQCSHKQPNKFYKNKMKMKTICKDHAIRSLRSRGAKPPDSGL